MTSPAIHNAIDNYRAVKRVLWGVLALNLLVAGLKASVALQTGSIAAMAELVHGILDASANVVGLIGLSYAASAPDERHPYGHHRFEALAALGIGILIAGGLFEVVGALIDGLKGTRTPPDIDAMSTGLLCATVVINFAVSLYEHRRGQALGSRLLKADAAHTLSDAMGVMVVLASFAAVHFGVDWADIAAAVFVAFLIGKTALKVIRENADALLDTAQVDPQEVHGLACAVPGVFGAHAIRSRGAQGSIALDLHIHVDPDSTVRDAHELTHQVKQALFTGLPGVQDVIIHTEPADGRELAGPVAPGAKPSARS